MRHDLSMWHDSSVWHRRYQLDEDSRRSTSYSSMWHISSMSHDSSVWHRRYQLCLSDSVTGWRRLIGSPKLQIIFHRRATKYRSLLQKITYKDKGSFESSPHCMSHDSSVWHRRCQLDEDRPVTRLCDMTYLCDMTRLCDIGDINYVCLTRLCHMTSHGT